jgi:hypothetical protein
MLKSWRHLIRVFLFSFIFWFARVFIVFSLLYAFQFDVPFWGAIVVLVMLSIAIMIQISPGNVGTFQFACILALSLFGVRKDAALSFSLVLHAVEMITVLALGFYSSVHSAIGLKGYPDSDDEEDDSNQPEPVSSAATDEEPKPSATPTAREKTGDAQQLQLNRPPLS